MSEPAGVRSRFLLAVAAAMGVTIVALTGWAMLSQNKFGIVATVQAYHPTDGTDLWTVELDVDHPPRFAGDLVVAVSKGDVIALGESGEVTWRTAIRDSRYAAAAAVRVYVEAGDHLSGRRVVFLDAADGSILWERKGTLLHAGADIAAISKGRHVVLVRSESGERINRLSQSNGARFAGNDSKLVRLRKRRVTVFTADGEAIELLGALPKRTWLLGIEGDAVVLSIPGADGRTVRGHDMATGVELWQKPQSEYEPPASAGPVTFYDRDLTLIAAQREGTHPVVALGYELGPVDGATRYFAVGADTYAVDAATSQMLWNRRGRLPVAATGGLAVFKQRGRYEVVASDTGEAIAEYPRKQASRVRAAGGRVVVDTGPRFVVVGRDGTGAKLYEGRAQLEALSDEYLVLSRKTELPTRPTEVVVLDLATGAEIFSNDFERINGPLELDEGRLRFNHAQNATEIDVATGEQASIDRYDFDRSPDELDMTPMTLAFKPGVTHLLWTAEASELSSVAAVGDSIVVSTPRFKHR